MKAIALVMICMLSLAANGQIKALEGKVNPQANKHEKITGNSPLQVIYLNAHKTDRHPAYFINGQHVRETTLKTMDLHSIGNISVVKEAITIDGQKYDGQLHITTKTDYNPEIISLADLKTKYIKPGNTPSIFIIDNEIVDGHYREFLIDEKFILKIEVQPINNEQEHLKLNVIRLITKTEANIKQANEIRIKGIDALKTSP